MAIKKLTKKDIIGKTFIVNSVVFKVMEIEEYIGISIKQLQLF